MVFNQFGAYAAMDACTPGKRSRDLVTRPLSFFRGRVIPLGVLIIGGLPSTSAFAQHEVQMRLGEEVSGGYRRLLGPRRNVIVTIDPVLDDVSDLAKKFLGRAEECRFKALTSFLEELSKSLDRKERERPDTPDNNRLHLMGAVHVGLRLLGEGRGSFQLEFSKGVKEEYENVVGYNTATPVFASSWSKLDPRVNWQVARPVGFYARPGDHFLPRLYRCVVYLRRVRLDKNPELLKALVKTVESSDRLVRARKKLAVLETCMIRLWGECDKLGVASSDRANALLGSRNARMDRTFLDCPDTVFAERFSRKPTDDSLGRLPHLFRQGFGCKPTKVLEANGSDYRSLFLKTLIGLASSSADTTLGPTLGSSSWSRRQLVAATHAYLTLRWSEALSAAGGPTTGKVAKPKGPRLFVAPCGDAFVECARAVRSLADTMRFLERERRRGTGPYISHLRWLLEDSDATCELLDSLNVAVKAQRLGRDMPEAAERRIRGFVERWGPSGWLAGFSIPISSKQELRPGPWRYFTVPLVVNNVTVEAHGITSTVETRKRLRDGSWSEWRQVSF